MRTETNSKHRYNREASHATQNHPAMCAYTYNSGRYCIEAPVDNKAPPFVKLDVIGSADFDDFISNGVNPDQLVLVACLREDDNACRNATQLLEHVNGTLASRFPADKDTGESKSPYVIVKFDMAVGFSLVLTVLLVWPWPMWTHLGVFDLLCVHRRVASW